MPKTLRQVRANGTLFVDLKKNLSYKEISRKAGVSAGTYLKLVKSRAVGVETLRLAARELKQPFEDCVLPRAALPLEPEFYVSLKHSYYVDQDAAAHSETPPWKQEHIHFHFDRKVRGGSGMPALRFGGVIENPGGIQFKFWASRTNDYHFAMAARSLSNTHAYHAIFSSHSAKALLGVWVGLNRMRVPSVYRTVLSQTELSEPELNQMVKSAWIDFCEGGSGLITMQVSRDAWTPPSWQ